jgi:hypothetical protein
VHRAGVHVVARAVVVEVAAAPITALVAVSYIAEAIVDAAIVANVMAPVAAIKVIAVIPVAPVAWRPECALVGSLDPHARYPVIAV